MISFQMIKNIIIIVMALAAHLPVQAQTAITRALNATRDGDSLVMSSLTDIPLLPVGHDVVWDLSQASPESSHTLFFTGEDSRAVATEGGTSWRTVIHGDTLLLTGFENRQCLMEYDKPLPLLRYPFSYGDSITGEFHGIGKWCDRRFMRVWGEGTTRAEGEGTLILPGGDTLRHVLMTRSLRRAYHITYDSIHTWDALLQAAARDSRGGLTDTAGIAPVVTENHSWYAPGLRYPVLRAVRSSDPLGTTTLTVLYPPESQLELDYDMENALVRQSQEPWGTPGGAGDDGHGHLLVSHSLGTDPSAQEVTLHLTLSSPACVSLLIADASGIAWRTVSQAFGSGGHSLSISYAGLPHGQYAVRVICGAETFSWKLTI